MVGGGEYGSDPSSREQANGSYTYNGNSNVAGDAVNAPTLQAAENLWNQKYGSSGNGSAAATTPASYTPQPIQSFGQVPQVSAAQATSGAAVTPYQAQAALVDPTQNQSYMQAAYAQNEAALAPQFAQQSSQLADANAARGITNSGAGAQLQANLYGQQAGALASADEPITSQGYSYEQGDIAANQANQQAANLANQGANIGVGEFNSGQQQQINLANQASQNQASNTNAGIQGDALNYNANAYNGYLNTLEGQQYNTGNELLGSYLGTYSPNSEIGSLISGGESAGASGYSQGLQNGYNLQDAALGAAGGAAGNYFSNIGGGNSGFQNDAGQYD
jgi:hypothetical protein